MPGQTRLNRGGLNASEVQTCWGGARTTLKISSNMIGIDLSMRGNKVVMQKLRTMYKNIGKGHSAGF